MTSSLRSRFDRSPRRGLYLSGNRLTSYHWQQGGLADALLFQRSDEGLADFGSYLEETRGLPTYLLVDLVEEEYRRDTMPHVLGGDRRNVIRYRVERAFRDTPYWHGAIQGREAEGRRDDRLLLSAVTNPSLVKPWVDRLIEHKVPLAGIYSLPLVSESLLPVIAATKGEALLVSLQSTGNLRQSFFLDRHLKLSRLAHMPLLAPEGVVQTVIDEVEKLRRYLNSLRLLRRDSVLQVYVLAHGPVMEEARRQCTSGPTTTFHLLDLAEVAEKVGMNPAFVTPYADSLFAHQMLRTRPPNHYARPAETRYFTYHRVRNALRASGVVLLVAGLLGGGFGVAEGMMLKQRAVVAAQQADYYKARYDEARGDLPPAPVEAADLKAAVETAQALEGVRTTPLPVLAAVSSALDRYPELQVEQVEWQLGRGAGQAPPQGGAAAYPALGTDQNEADGVVAVAVVSGRVGVAETDARQALQVLSGFSNALKALPGVTEVKVLSQPVSVSPRESLRGDMKAAMGPGRADFSIQVVYRRDDAAA